MSTPEARLDSWKAIAQYLGRDERTVQRWELDRGLPVHRLPGAKRGGIFGYAAELDAWMVRKPEPEASKKTRNPARDDADAAGRLRNKGGNMERRPRLQFAFRRTLRRRSALLFRNGACPMFRGANCGVGGTPGCACPILCSKARKLSAGRCVSGLRERPDTFARFS